MALEERVRVAAPDGLVAEVDGVTGRRYKATGGGMYEMHPRDAQALLREGGFVPSVGGMTRGGYVCPCGFRPVVRTCSRCGGRAETQDERRARLAVTGDPMAYTEDVSAPIVLSADQFDELMGGITITVVDREWPLRGGLQVSTVRRERAQ